MDSDDQKVKQPDNAIQNDDLSDENLDHEYTPDEDNFSEVTDASLSPKHKCGDSSSFTDNSNVTEISDTAKEYLSQNNDVLDDQLSSTTELKDDQAEDNEVPNPSCETQGAQCWPHDGPTSETLVQDGANVAPSTLTDFDKLTNNTTPSISPQHTPSVGFESVSLSDLSCSSGVVTHSSDKDSGEWFDQDRSNSDCAIHSSISTACTGSECSISNASSNTSPEHSNVVDEPIDDSSESVNNHSSDRHEADHENNENLRSQRHELPTVVDESIQCKELSSLSCDISQKDDSDYLLSELESELESTRTTETELVTGNNPSSPIHLPVIPSEPHNLSEDWKTYINNAQSAMQRMEDEKTNLHEKLDLAIYEKEACKRKLQACSSPEQEDIYDVQIKELENTITEQERELKRKDDNLRLHDTAAKNAIVSLRNDLTARLDRGNKVYEEVRKEKETMTMRYAQAEQKNIELQDKMTKNDNKMREMIREKDVFMVRFRAMRGEKQKSQELFEAKAAELAATRRELEKQKEGISSSEVKAKWAQNKLKAELDSHKETKVKIEELQRKLKQAKEETEQIRRDCQAMIKTYQESEEIRSNSLDHKLKEKHVQLLQHQQERSDVEEIHALTKRELESLKSQHKDVIEESKTIKDKIQCLEAERIIQEETLKKFKDTLQNQKTDNHGIREGLEKLKDVDKELSSEKDITTALRSKITQMETTIHDLENDLSESKKREMEHLEFSQKISDKNAFLQSENTTLSRELTSIMKEKSDLVSNCEMSQKKLHRLETEQKEDRDARKESHESLSARLEAKVKECDQLATKLADEQSEMKTMKRKHMANMKDMMRQLNIAKKKGESSENKHMTDGTSIGSMGSRTSSNASLDTAGSGNHLPVNSSVPGGIHHEDSPPLVEVREVDRQLLMDKIVRLQKAHARKNEKMEFMEDHINQLIVEVKKKTKIIQSFIMKEESGALTSEKMDLNKALLSKKGGIMASVYSSHAQDGAMNLELSLEINRKLQALLEDTLLKNITLKENMDTLGKEIARLSQDNRKLQTHLQQIS